MLKRILLFIFGPDPVLGICETCGEEAINKDYTICISCAEYEDMCDGE